MYMKAAIKNIILMSVICSYVFGAAGFTVHHCCCTHTFHTTSAIVSIFTPPYSISECEDHTQCNCDDSIKIRKARYCGDEVYSLDGVQYNNVNNLEAPEYIQIELLELLSYHKEDSIKPVQLGENNLYFDTSPQKYRHWHSYNILCTFRI